MEIHPVVASRRGSSWMMARNCGPSSIGRVYKSVSGRASVAQERAIRRSSAPQSRSTRKRAGGAIALVVGLVLALAGCNTITVSSSGGVLTATVGTNTVIYWYFFNQDFKDFASSRTSTGATASSVYDIATVSHPGSKYIKIRQDVTGASQVSGSGSDRQVLLKANEFANQGDGLSLSATETITLQAPAFGFTWLTGGKSTQVTTVVPSDLCGLFVMAVTDQDPFDAESAGFYSDIVATTHTYNCASPVSTVIEPAPGPPGIFLYVAGPVGRSASESPIHYGADRISAASTYLLTVTGISNIAPTVTTLAEGTIDADGSFSSMTRLPALAPSVYNIRFVGTHANGSTLQLTSQITIGETGEFTSIGENIPVIR